MNHLKILISAYACEPHKGSEPGVGWNWAKQIAKFADTWVITRANNRDVIEEEMKKSPVPNLHFLYYDVPKWLSFWKKKTRGLYLYYLLWQIGAYRLAKSINKQEKFDVVHHLTFGNIWLPTFMPFLNIPFIWGPVGGGEQVPKQFRRNYKITAKFQEFFRDLILYSLKVNPLFLYTCKRASLIISRTKETFSIIPESLKGRTVKIIETGIEIKDIPIKEGSHRKNSLQLISVGRLIHWKGFDLALMAFSEILKDNKDAKMIIIGNGPDRYRLQKICQRKNIMEKVIFAGHLNREEVLKFMSESDIFFYPSLKEGGAWVFLEAMSLGLPIICLDVAGAGEIVNEQCGIKIQAINPDQTINDLSAAILELANAPELRRKMGEAGKQRVREHFNWDNKGELIRKIYSKIGSNE